MILHMGGGGGAAGLKMDITGGTVQPTGVENRIWINTATAIGTVTVDDAAPSSPAAGDVYIELDAASAAVVQLGKGSRIVMLPLGIAYQYDGSAWVSMNAYVYLSGAWVPFSTDIPDGDTTTPVNDTNTWLRCAGINPSSEGNPTLAQVVASATLCATLMASANAVNYMIRSTTIQTAVLGSATALVALDNSSPFVSSVMTSDSAPTGYAASASSTFDANHAAYKITAAATSSEPGWWTIASQSGDKWCAVTIPSDVWAYKFALGVSCYNGSYVSTTAKVQWSDDGTTWTDAATITNNIQGSGVFALQAATAQTGQHRRYRVIFTSPTGGTYYYANNFKVYGKTREVAA